MSENVDKTDWSQERWKRMLIVQRKFMWPEDTVEKIASWLGMKQGMTVVDVGCGLGYLGYTYWPYFGRGGRYTGVDLSQGLFKEAVRDARKWARRGKAYFLAGDALKLPFKDSFADIAMCQTLLMHQSEPELVLAEMTRIVRPGGLVVCKEPDNLSSMMSKKYSSQPELSVEEELLMKKLALIGNKGRMKLGRGDWNIGPKVPIMMKKLGLVEIDARNNDNVNIVQPPYETAKQKHGLEMAKHFLGIRRDRKERSFWKNRQKEEFLAGGGELKEFERAWKIYNRIRRTCRRQIERGTYFSCGSGFFYVIKGRKPRRKK
jgi:ubiquinone/menaquinone biosynthesis C-methylase UbiE